MDMSSMMGSGTYSPWGSSLGSMGFPMGSMYGGGGWQSQMPSSWQSMMSMPGAQNWMGGMSPSMFAPGSGLSMLGMWPMMGGAPFAGGLFGGQPGTPAAGSGGSPTSLTGVGNPMGMGRFTSGEAAGAKPGASTPDANLQNRINNEVAQARRMYAQSSGQRTAAGLSPIYPNKWQLGGGGGGGGAQGGQQPPMPVAPHTMPLNPHMIDPIDGYNWGMANPSGPSSGLVPYQNPLPYFLQ